MARGICYCIDAGSNVFFFLLVFCSLRATVDLTSGGCGCRDSFMNTVISQETYEDEGPEVVHKLNIFAMS